MVDPSRIGTKEYSKVLKRNVDIVEGPSDDFYKLVGLEYVLIKDQPKKEKLKFPKVDQDTESNE